MSTHQPEKDRQRYEDLFQNSLDAIFIANSELQIIDLNPAMRKMLGYDYQQHATLKDIFISEDEFSFLISQLYKNEAIDDFEAEFRCLNGKKVTGIINMVRSVSATGVDTYQGIIRNISRRKQAEKELIMAEKLSMTGKIARSIAHEVRNPLTNLHLALEQLEEEVSDSAEDATFYVEIIRRNANRIGDLISDLLDSSKPKELLFEESDMKSILEDSIRLISDRAKLNSIELKYKPAANLPAINADGSQLKVAFVNLLVNALEAVQNHSGKIEVSTFADTKHLFVKIADNGKGVPPENIPQLFEPFFSAKRDGMGLGLTTVQNIVRQHKGKIEVESELGKGTAFKMSFPIFNQ